MHVVFICPYFKKLYFISFLDFQTCVFQHFIHFVVEYYFPILCWTYKVVNQDRYVVTIPPGLTHPLILLFFAASCGEMPSFDYTQSALVKSATLLCNQACEEKAQYLHQEPLLVSQIFRFILGRKYKIPNPTYLAQREPQSQDPFRR